MGSLGQKTTARRRRGAVILLMLFVLLLMVCLVALAIDVGLMVLLRAEVQNAVDAGALAATIQLRDNPRDIAAAEAAARDFVQQNRVGMHVTVPEDAIDVEHGVFDRVAGTFSATPVEPNAVRVFARQDKQPFFFARILGHETFGAPASAIASGGGRPADIMLVLDLSGSMAQEGRIQALWKAAPVFVEIIENAAGDDQIGVMGLAAEPRLYDPAAKGHTGVEYVSGLHPTSDHYVGVLEFPLTGKLRDVRSFALSSTNLPASKYTGWTGTGAAIGDAAHYLTNAPQARAQADKIIVLMSDGHANKPTGNGTGYAQQMARFAAAREVIIHTISLGNDADVGLMEKIARITGGEHFDATGAGEAQLTQRLTAAFQQAAALIKRVQLVK